jgi:hypothetical protein
MSRCFEIARGKSKLQRVSSKFQDEAPIDENIKPWKINALKD